MQVAVLDERIKQQNVELATCYKERACLAEELVKTNRQLQVNLPPLAMPRRVLALSFAQEAALEAALAKP